MRSIYKTLLVLVAILGLWLPIPAHAANFYQVCNAGNAQANSSTVCRDGGNTSDPLAGSNGLIVKISGIIAYVAGTVAVIILFLSGLRYINSGGDPQKTTAARNGIIYAIVGLIVIISAQYIISLVMSRIK